MKGNESGAAWLRSTCSRFRIAALLGLVAIQAPPPGHAQRPPEPRRIANLDLLSHGHEVNVLGVLDHGWAFAAAEGTVGREAWWTDGTPAGTFLLADLHPGVRDGAGTVGWRVGDRIVFAGLDEHGPGIWSTDGTRGGTERVARGTASGDAAVVGGVAWIVLRPGDPLAPVALVRTDGTSGGTAVACTPSIDCGFRDALSVHAAGSTLFILGSREPTGMGLYAMEAGDASPRLLLAMDTMSDVRPGRSGAWFLVGSGASAETWYSDGTMAGTQRIESARITIRAVLGDTALFHVDEPGGDDVWAMDPVPGSRRRLVESTLWYGGAILALETWAFLEVRRGSRTETWRTDGTPAGTTLLADVGAADGLTVRSSGGNRILFDVRSGSPSGLWLSDGSVSGTLPLRFGANDAAIVGDRIVHGPDPAVRDALGSAPPVVLRDMQLGAWSGEPDSLGAAGRLLAFIAGGRVYTSDGTEAGTVERWRDPSPFPRDARLVASVLGRYVFTRHASGTGLFAVDDQGVRTLHEDVTRVVPGAAAGDLYVFGGADDLGREPWVTDGTSAGTALLADVEPGRSDSFDRAAAVPGGVAFSRANHLMWHTDGRSAPVPLRSSLVGTKSFTVDGTIHLLADSEWSDCRCTLWTTDCTRAGTQQVPPQPDFIDHVDAVGLSSGLIALVKATPFGTEPWAYDPASGYELLADVRPGPEGSEPAELLALGNRALFVATDPIHGREAWVTDGTPGGTRLLTDINPGPRGSDPRSLSRVGEVVVFSAHRDDLGSEPWVTDGTPEGTRLLFDLVPGPTASHPREFTVVGDMVFFTAWTPQDGTEPWVMELDSDADGIRNADDWCPGQADRPENDADGDGLMDACEDAVLAPPAFIDDLRVRKEGADVRLEWSPVTGTVLGRSAPIARYRVQAASAPVPLAQEGSVVAEPLSAAARLAGDIGGGGSLACYAVAAVDPVGLSGGLGHDFPRGIRDLVAREEAGGWSLTWTPVSTDVSGRATSVVEYHVHASSSPLTRVRVELEGLAPLAVVPGPPTMLPAAPGRSHFLVLPVDIQGNVSLE